jgi:polyferredoxin
VKIRHLVWLRRTLQAFFLIFFLFLVIESRLPQDVYIDYNMAFSADQELRLDQPVTFFFQLDPLIGISSLLSGYTFVKGFLWGAGILVLTILLGRIFCGFICPFGTIHHAVGTFKPALKGSRMVQANLKTSD